jgi:purine-binding chemotaxis protein CheW
MSNTIATSNPPGIGALAGRYLTFMLGTDSYGLPVLNVREIIRLCPITPVPRMPDYVKGVINLRGTVIAVIDLRAKFEMPASTLGDRCCVIIVQIRSLTGGASTLMGAVVDAVEEVVNLGASDIEPTPDFGGTLDTRYMLGVATIRGGVKTLLDIEKIFQEDGSLAMSAAPLSTPAAPSKAT